MQIDSFHSGTRNFLHICLHDGNTDGLFAGVGGVYSTVQYGYRSCKLCLCIFRFCRLLVVRLHFTWTNIYVTRDESADMDAKIEGLIRGDVWDGSNGKVNYLAGLMV